MLTENDCLHLSTRKAFFGLAEQANKAVSYTDKYLEKSAYICIVKNEYMDFWSPLDTKQKPFHTLLENYLAHPKYLLEYEEIATAKLNKLEKSIFKLSPISAWKEFCIAYRAAPRGINLLRKLDHALAPILKSNFTPEQITALSYPLKESEVNLEHKAILAAALRVTKKELNDSEIRKIAIKLQHKFAHVPMGYYNESSRSVAYYELAISAAISQNPKKGLQQIKKSEQAALADCIKAGNAVPKSLKNLKIILRALPYLKDWYKMIINRCLFLGYEAFSDYARKDSISPDDIFRMSEIEAGKFFESGSIPTDLIEQRKRTYVYNGSTGEVLYGNDAKRFISGFYNKRKIESELKGRIAYQGIAHGPARIILSSYDFHKFREGDIIVAVNTTPDFVPIIKKAAGIIAEEGGVTAHVGVVSREFRIPCIMGIKGATTIFSDGEQIVLDAVEGIVKRSK